MSPSRDWKFAVSTEFNRRANAETSPTNDFPLISSTIGTEEVLAAVDSVLNGQLSMNNEVREFENMFAQQVGAPFAVMCNSGSSANLLALAALTNHLRSLACAPVTKF